MADTKFSSLQKMFTIVPSAKHDDFIGKYYAPAEGTTRDTKYDGKIVFLEATGEIFTHGVLYATNTDSKLTEIKAVILQYLEAAGHHGYANVGNEIDAIVGALNASNIINFSYTENGYEVATTISLAADNDSINLMGEGTDPIASVAVATSKEAINGSTSADVDGKTSYIAATSHAIKEYVEDKLGDIADALTFEGGSAALAAELASESLGAEAVGDLFVATEDGTATVGDVNYSWHSGDSVIVTEVAGGKVAKLTIVEQHREGMVNNATADAAELQKYHVVLGAGNDSVQDSAYTIGGEHLGADQSSSVLATESAVAYAVSSAVENLDVTEYTLNADGIVKLTYSETDGIVTVKDLTYTAANAVWDVDAHTLTDPAADGFVTKAGSDALHSYITYVASLVDAVDQSETTVYTYAGSTNYLDITDHGTTNDHDYEVKVLTSEMSDFVNLVYNETTKKWETSEGTEVGTGLATASDVAKTIIDDEKVIAAALNDHEGRIQALEAKEIGDATYTSAATEGISVKVDTTAGKVSNVEVDVTAGVVTYTAATASTAANLEATTEGVLDETAVPAIKNYIDAKDAELDAKIQALDESYTTVARADDDANYMTITDRAAEGENDHDYLITLLRSTVAAGGNEGARTLTASDGLLDNNSVDAIATYAYNVAADAAANAVAGLDKEETTYTNGNLEIKYKEENGIVSVTDLTYTAADVSVSYLVVTANNNGLVTAEVLASTINNLDPWEEYTE